MKKFTAIVFLAIVIFFITTFNCFADDPPAPFGFYGHNIGGHASYEGESLTPGSSEASGSASLYDEYEDVTYTGDTIFISTGQTAKSEIDASGGESEGKVQGAGQQESIGHIIDKKKDWEDAYAQAFAFGSQYGQSGFFGKGSSLDGDTQIEGKGIAHGEIDGYVYNYETTNGYRSEAGMIATNTGDSVITFAGEDVDDVYAYSEGSGEVKAGSYAGAEFSSKIVAKAESYGEASFDYSVTSSIGTGGIEATSVAVGSAQTEGYSEVWQVGNSVYAESWHKSVSSFNNAPTFSSVSGSVGGSTSVTDTD
jgi:hypothetical protein